jgi:hypothetical protein
VASWAEKQLVKEAAGHRPGLAQLKLVHKLLTINISKINHNLLLNKIMIQLIIQYN